MMGKVEIPFPCVVMELLVREKPEEMVGKKLYIHKTRGTRIIRKDSKGYYIKYNNKRVPVVFMKHDLKNYIIDFGNKRTHLIHGIRKPCLR